MILALLLIFLIAKADLPPEPPPGPSSPYFVDWNPQPNGLVVFSFDIDQDGKVDYTTSRIIHYSGVYESTEDIRKITVNDNELIIFFWDAPVKAYRWYVIARYPIFYQYGDMLYKDSEETGDPSKAILYEITGTEKKI